MTGGRLQEGHPEDFQKARRNRIKQCHKRYLKTKRRLSPHLQGPDDAETNASVHSAVDENIHNLAWGSEKVKKAEHLENVQSSRDGGQVLSACLQKALQSACNRIRTLYAQHGNRRGFPLQAVAERLHKESLALYFAVKV